ncbi:MAG: phosphoribosyl-AMP cyclohydrolase [Planctomycetota bacterium]|nr:phosphoribosyl-AMP cyclohydrolase [Planctomycetota bacterium]MCX8040725.1 phosphoribosyl-AMP cyclohydrolase [Planctomycetota bacterium]MDW8372340.1 phosphoribosyl-AMP cyclohydrolase [Planctomycetota bacterium]
MPADIAPRGEPGEVERLIAWNEQGLALAIAQEHASGEILMVAWIDREALWRTLTTGWATYWSRSRGRLWVKGEESGFRQRVVEVRLDCDGDVVLYRVEAPGPACHQRRRSCFSHRVEADGSVHTDRPVIA